jgi:Na+/melibiose symporter-like transporter
VSEAITTILPYALGAAVSPLLLTVEILILASGTRPRQRAWLYTAGAAVVGAVIVILVAFVFRSLVASGDGPSPFTRGIEAAIGLVLLALAARAFIPRHRAESHHPGRIEEMMKSGKSKTFVIIGMIMMGTNLSSIVILIPGIHAMEALRPGIIPGTVALAVLLFFLMLPALIPVGLVTLLGSRADPLLASLNRFVTKHARAITGILCLVIAAFLLIAALR